MLVLFKHTKIFHIKVMYALACLHSLHKVSPIAAPFWHENIQNSPDVLTSKFFFPLLIGVFYCALLRTPIAYTFSHGIFSSKEALLSVFHSY